MTAPRSAGRVWLRTLLAVAVSAGLVGLLAASALRVARSDASPAWLERALPIRRGAVFVGRAGAAALLPLAMGIAAALGLAAGGASSARLAFVAALGLPLAVAAAACARLPGRLPTWSYGACVAAAAAAGGIVP